MKCHHMLPLLLLLAGCAAKPSAPETCLIEKIQEIPVGGGRGFITVPAVWSAQ